MKKSFNVTVNEQNLQKELEQFNYFDGRCSKEVNIRFDQEAKLDYS